MEADNSAATGYGGEFAEGFCPNYPQGKSKEIHQLDFWMRQRRHPTSEQYICKDGDTCGGYTHFQASGFDTPSHGGISHLILRTTSDQLGHHIQHS